MSVDSLLNNYPDIWQTSVSNELGRLAQGVRNIKGNNVLKFITKEHVPKHKKVTYARMVCDIRPKKDNVYRTRLTVGGDRLDFFSNASSPAASLLDTKIIVNSVISNADEGARFITLDLKDYFLQSDLPEAEYMKIHGRYFFNNIRQKYNIDDLIANDGYVYCKIVKGCYGLKQAAMLAHKKLIKHLKPFGYSPDFYAPNIWKHVSRPTKFCLCVDDFGIKTFSNNDTDHLINALKQEYNIKVDYSGKEYCGLHLEWNYKKGYVDVSMPNYVSKTIQKTSGSSKYKPPKKPQHSPHQWIPPNYNQKIQLTPPPDKSKLLNPKEITIIQSIVGSFLYYGRAVEPVILPAINEIGSI